MTTVHPGPAPGWYPDPGGNAPRRWWDGARWTDATSDEPFPVCAPPAEVILEQRASLSRRYDQLQRDRVALVGRLAETDAGLATIGYQLQELAAPHTPFAAGPSPTPFPSRDVPPPPAARLDPAPTPLAVGGPRSQPPPPLPPLPSRSQPATPTPAPGASEWRRATVGNVLLGLGTLLLTIAALVFATVAWPTLDDRQRALVLFGVTMICGAGTVVLHNRLRNTAEAFSVLFLGFLLVDWLAVRRAGLGAGMGATWWWATGFALGAIVATGTAVVLRLRLPQVVAVVLAHLSLVCGVFALTERATQPALATTLLLALVASTSAVAALAIARLGAGHAAAATATVAATVVEAMVFVAAMTTLGSEGTGVPSGLAILAIGGAPAIARALRPDAIRQPVLAHGLVAISTSAVVWGTTVALAAVFPGWSVVAVIAVVGLLAFVLGTFGPGVSRVGASVAGLVALGCAAAIALFPTLAVAFGSWSSFSVAWRLSPSSPALQALVRSGAVPASETGVLEGAWIAIACASLAVAAGILVVGTARGRRRLPASLGSAAAGVLAMAAGVALAVGLHASILVVVLILLVAATLFLGVALGQERAAEPFGVAPLVPLLLALGAGVTAATWSAFDRWCTVVALLVLAVITMAGAVITRQTVLRSVLVAWAYAVVLGTAAAVPAAAHQSHSVVALAVTLTAALGLIIGAALLPRFEVHRVAPFVTAFVGVAVGAVGALDSWSSGPWLATITIGLLLPAAMVAATYERLTDLRALLAAVAATSMILVSALIVAAAGAPAAWTGFAVVVAAGVLLGVAAYALTDLPQERSALVIVSLPGLLVGLGVVFDGWSNGQPWATVAGVVTAGAVLALVAPRTTSLALRVSVVAAASVLVLGAVSLAAIAAGASDAAAGLVLGAASAVAIVGASTMLHANESQLDVGQRAAVLAVGLIAGAFGVAMTFAGDGLFQIGVPLTGGWDADPWLTVAAVSALIVAIAVAASQTPERELRAALAAIAAGALVADVGLVIVACGAPVAWVGTGAVAASGATLTGATYLLGRHHAERVALQVVAGISLILGLDIAFAGWFDGTRWATVAALAAVAAAAAAVAPRLHEAVLRAGTLASAVAAAVSVVALGAAAAGADVPVVGLLTVGCGGVAVIGATWLVPWVDRSRASEDRVVVEVVGLLAVLVGATLAASDPERLAEAFTISVPAFAVAGLRADRVAYRWAAVTAAVFAVWAWLAVGDVRVVEAYTLPAAAGALAAGVWAWRRRPALSSWFLFGPGLALALLPSLALSVTGDTVARPLALLVATAAVVLLGAWKRLQAPVIIGAGAMTVLAVDTLWPVAAQVPRWILLAAAGVVFVWLGATIERRVRQAGHLRDVVGHLH